MSDRALWLIGGVIGLIAVVTLAWGLFADRSRGGRRCPRCWYDMSGTTTLTCSECGRTVRRERGMRKTRRRWRRILAGLLLLAVAGGFAATPRFRRDGGVGLVPTWVLVLALPELDEHFRTGGWRDRAFRELMGARAKIHIRGDPKHDLPDWEWRRLIDRALSAFEDPEPIDISALTPRQELYRKFLRQAKDAGLGDRVGFEIPDLPTASDPKLFLPESWPANVELPFFVETPDWTTGEIHLSIADESEALEWRPGSRPGGSRNRRTDDAKVGLLTLPSWAEGDLAIRFRRRFEVLAHDTTGGTDRTLVFVDESNGSTFVYGTLDDFIKPVADPAIDAILRENFAVEVDQPSRTVTLRLGPECNEYLAQVGYVGCVDLLHAGVVEQRVCAVIEPVFTEGGRYSDSAVLHLPALSRIPAGDPRGWSLRFSVDPEIVLLWEGGREYWDGAIEVGLGSSPP